MKPEIEAVLVLSGANREEVDAGLAEGWANWIAQDQGGAWYLYEEEPVSEGKWGRVWLLPNKGLTREVGSGSEPTDYTKMIFKL